MKTGFLGRFQPLHIGHHKVIQENKDKDFHLIIGSSNKSRTEKNPLTLKERKKIIQACHPKIEILGLEDFESDKKWAEKLEKLGLDKIITGNQNTIKIIKQHTSLQVQRPEKYNKEIYNSTEVRRRIKSGEEWRYLTPKCSHPILENQLKTVKKSGTQYNFEPGWKRKNAFHGTADK